MLPVKMLFILAGLVCLTPYMGSASALFLGFGLAISFGNPFQQETKKWTSYLLSLSVMGLGAGMDLSVIAKVGLQGVGYTVAGLLFTFCLGTFIGKLLGIEKETSLLITSGTAICGGSAIAAVAPVIRAKSDQISVALGCVFILNALALLIFPYVGHLLNLSETQFGIWCALAIHDTSSVVGASLRYGAEALKIATTLKLARALWIIPVAFTLGLVVNSKKTSSERIKKPWFILGFILMAALVTWVPSLQPVGHQIEAVAKQFLVLTLFLIGASLTRQTLKSVGLKPLLQAVLLWALVVSGTLAAILAGWISL